MLSSSEWHEKHHRRKNDRPYEESECFLCISAKARCREKKNYKSRAIADKEALRINIERNWFPGECLKPYRCRYCNVWHLTTAVRMVDQTRVEKMRSRWLRKTGKRRSA